MDYEKRIVAIEQRNQNVKTDKAWETSWTRRLSITAITYVLAVLFMWSINIPHPHLSALVPTVGFFISTLTLGFLKTMWVKKYEDREDE